MVSLQSGHFKEVSSFSYQATLFALSVNANLTKKTIFDILNTLKNKRGISFILLLQNIPLSPCLVSYLNIPLQSVCLVLQVIQNGSMALQTIIKKYTPVPFRRSHQFHVAEDNVKYPLFCF